MNCNLYFNISNDSLNHFIEEIYLAHIAFLVIYLSVGIKNMQLILCKNT